MNQNRWWLIKMKAPTNSFNNSKRKFREFIKRIIVYRTTLTNLNHRLAISMTNNSSTKKEMASKKFQKYKKSKIIALVNIRTTEVVINQSWKVRNRKVKSLDLAQISKALSVEHIYLHRHCCKLSSLVLNK